MPRFAANLTMLYGEHPFENRFAAAAADGFVAVEFLFPYAYAAEALRARLQENGLQQVLFNAPPAGHTLEQMAAAWDAGARGTACLPGREAEFRAGVAHALAYAHTLQCPRIHVMAGLVPPDADRAVLQATYEANLRWAATQAAAQGVELLIEPLNPVDVPGYFLSRQDHAHATVQAVGAPNLKVQMDLYHCQRVEGNVAGLLRQYLPTGRIGHIQIAGVPDRHEPDTGDLHYPPVFALLDALGYSGWVGCEYRPRLGAQVGATSTGLRWLREWGGMA